MTETARQIRGSGLLVGGRLFAIVVNLAVQVVVVRYLAQSDYGAFAYVLSIVTIVETLATLGLDRTIGRFIPVYHEQGDVARLLGTLLTIMLTIGSVGVATVLVIVAGADLIGGGGADGATLRTLLVIMAALGPIQAVDHLFENLLAAFGRPGAIVIRRHVVGPLLKLGVVLGVAGMGASVDLLGAGYLVAGAIGVALYAPLLRSSLRDVGVLDAWRDRTIVLPWRELFAFALPLLAIDAALVIRSSVDAIIVEAFHGTSEVALLRSVQPVARLNQLVFASFAILFMPMAARLMARERSRELQDLYWQSAVWQALVSFPIAAATIVLAPAITELLFGAAYRDAGPVMALLSLGYYANAATGQNSLTLRAFGRVRIIVIGALAVGALTLLLDFALIPGLGAVGAAAAMAMTLVVHNVYNQIAMHRTTTVGLPDRGTVGVYLALATAIGGLALLEVLLRPPLVIGLVLVAAAFVVLLARYRRQLRVAATFPELRRLPLLGRWL